MAIKDPEAKSLATKTGNKKVSEPAFLNMAVSRMASFILEESQNCMYNIFMQKTNLMITIGIFIMFFFSACGNTENPGPATGQNTESAGNSFSEAYKFISATDGLRIRSQPNQEGKVLGLIPYAERVKIVEINPEVVAMGGTEGRWTKVLWTTYAEDKQKETIGWVFDGYLSDKVDVSPSIVRTRFTLFGAREVSGMIIPDIPNQIMGIEPPPPSSSNEKACIVELFGNAFLFEKNYRINGNITMEAVSATGSYKKSVVRDSIQTNNEGRFYFYFQFENKYWLNTTRWRFLVKDMDSVIYDEKMEMPQVDVLIYVIKSNDPFEKCAVSDFSRGVRYTYAARSNKDGIVVFYFTQTWELYKPVLVVSRPGNVDGKDTFQFQFELSPSAPPGAFCIRQYDMNKIPSSEEKQAVFGSYQLL